MPRRRVVGRPALPVGTFGKITVSGTRQPYKARTRLRDKTGTIRYVARFGQTKTAAENALKSALSDYQLDDGLSRTTRINDLADEWLEDVKTSNRADSTKEHYEYAVDRYVRPKLGNLRIAEATTAVCDSALNKVAKESGPAAAKAMKAVLTGMLGLAVRHDAVDTNPVRETKITVPRRKKTVRALTIEETAELVALVTRAETRRLADKKTPYDLPDLIDFMLATGCRIGEACAVRDDVLDLDAGTVEINATIVRLKGRGLILQERPKTAAGWRRLALPTSAVDTIRRRDLTDRLKAPHGVVFGSPASKSLRDKSNTAADLREVLDATGFSWVTSHVFRKTVATRLDEAGWTARQIADQLGHAQPSMTMDVYMGRQVTNADAARALAR